MDPDRIADYLLTVADRAGVLVYVECPVMASNKESQIIELGRLRERLRRRTEGVKLVADEWCNTLEDVREFADAKCCDMIQVKAPDLGSVAKTIEAILYCNAHGVESYLGGSCNETDVSARCCVQIGMATRPTRILVKPGMDFDVGYTIVHNEMMRIIGCLERIDREWPDCASKRELDSNRDPARERLADGS
jgi:methylaspartate ammonia-lyase